MKNYEKYRIKIERAKEREDSFSRGGDAQRMADLSSAMQMLYLGRKYEENWDERVSKIRGRRPVIHQWKIRPSCHRAAGINKLRKSGVELEELELDLDPIAESRKLPNSHPLLVSLHLASFSRPSSPLLLPSSHIYYSKKKSPSFVFYDISRKESDEKFY